MFSKYSLNEKVFINTCSNCDPQFAKYKDLAKSFSEKIIETKFAGDAATLENYTDQGLDLDSQILISIAYENGEPIAFSGMKNNLEFYPNNSVRILNRFYILPETRIQTASSGRLSFRGKPRDPVLSVAMARNQAEMAQQLGYDYAFISREAFNPRWLANYHSKLNKRSSLDWQISEDLMAVCYLGSPRCWQHIIYSKLSDAAAEWNPQNTMSADMFKQRFMKNDKGRATLV